MLLAHTQAQVNERSRNLLPYLQRHDSILEFLPVAANDAAHERTPAVVHALSLARRSESIAKMEQGAGLLRNVPDCRRALFTGESGPGRHAVRHCCLAAGV